MTSYERALLDRLLSVHSAAHESTLQESSFVRVRTLDACGCIEFEDGARSPGPVRIVAEAFGPADHNGIPLEVMLSVAGPHLLWLEFIRYGGDNQFWPPVEAFEIIEFRR